jgi:hypothetical protein
VKTAVFNVLITMHPQNQYFFVVQSQGNVFNPFPDNDAKNVSTESYTLTAKVQAQYPSIGL